MMQTADLGYSHDGTQLRWLYAPRHRCIPLQREMRAGLVVVADVFPEDQSEMVLAQNDQMVQAFAPDGPEDPFGVGILPGGLRSGDDLPDAQPCHPVTEPIAVVVVTISEQISGLGSFCWERFDDLLGGPLRPGASGAVDVQDAPPVMGQDDEAEEKAEGGGRDHEEVARGCVAEVIPKKGAPGL